MCKVILSFFLICFYSQVLAQPKRSIRVTVVNEKKNALPGSTVSLLTEDSIVIRSAAANAAGTIEFTNVNAGKYLVKASESGHKEGYSRFIDLEKDASFSDTI